MGALVDHGTDLDKKGTKTTKQVKPYQIRIATYTGKLSYEKNFPK